MVSFICSAVVTLVCISLEKKETNQSSQNTRLFSSIYLRLCTTSGNTFSSFSSRSAAYPEPHFSTFEGYLKDLQSLVRLCQKSHLCTDRQGLSQVLLPLLSRRRYQQAVPMGQRLSHCFCWKYLRDAAQGDDEWL